MTTTVGTEKGVVSLLEDLIKLDYDAAEAYQAAVDRLQNVNWQLKLAAFKQDHLRHTGDLGDLLQSLNREPPKEGDMKRLLAKGKVMFGGLMGDDAILHAMQTNEADTNTAYERAVQFPGLAAETRTVLEANLADERRHCAWILEQLDKR